MTARCTALFFGLLCHASFACAVVVMASALFGGMDIGPLRPQGAVAVWQDVALLLQFPILHSFFLGKRGRGMLARLLPGDLGKSLVTTTFVILASVQVIALFGFWAPLGSVRWQPSGALLWCWSSAYAASWVLLAVAMWNAGLGTQMGFLGWLSVWRGSHPEYPDFPTEGLYRVCRHPVYFAMSLVALLGPVWTLDHACIAAVFCCYCVVGPLVKDRRYRIRYGERFERYQREVPFFPMLGI